MARLAELGREGVLLLCGDSTNVDRAGVSDSESIVGPHLDRVFARCEGRIVVTCFASNIHRVQQVVARGREERPQGRAGRPLDAQERQHRPQRSATSTSRRGCCVPPREIDQFADEKIVVISTGSQGEPLSALRRMAYRDHPQVELKSRRHGRLQRHADPRQRARGQRDDRPALPHRLRGRDGPRRADPRLRPRLRGGGQDDDQPHAPEVRDAGPRRLQADADPQPARAGRRRPGRAHLPHRERHCRWRSTPTAPASASRCRPGMIFVDGVDIGDVSDVALRDRRMLSRRRHLHHRRDDLRAGRLVRRPARGARPRRAVPGGQQRLHRRAARGGRGLARRRRRAADHRDRRAGVASCTTTSRSSSTTGSSAARWCCRSSSRSDDVRPQDRGHDHEHQDPRPRPRTRCAGSRGRRARRRAGSRRRASPRRATRAGPTSAPGIGGVASCSAVITATHWTPLPAPPTHREQRTRRAACPPATSRGRRRRSRRVEIRISAKRRAPLDDEVEQAAEHDAGAPRGEQDAEAGVGRPEALLGVDDLDRDDEREADQRERLADQQRAHRPDGRARSSRPSPKRSRHGCGRSCSGVGQVARDGAARPRSRANEAASTSSAARDAELRDQQAGQRGAADRRDREAEVHQRVALAEQALGLQQRRRPRRASAPRAGDRERAVDQRRAASTSGEQEGSPCASSASSGEHDRLDDVERRQRRAQRRAGRGARSGRREQRREELRDEEERRRWARRDSSGRRRGRRARRRRRCRRAR